MRYTMVCVPIESRAARRLAQIVATHPGLEIRVYHQRGRDVYSPHYEGWGRIGDPTFYHLFAREDVTREEVHEIVESLEEAEYGEAITCP